MLIHGRERQGALVGKRLPIVRVQKQDWGAEALGREGLGFPQKQRKKKRISARNREEEE